MLPVSTSGRHNRGRGTTPGHRECWSAFIGHRASSEGRTQQWGVLLLINDRREQAWEEHNCCFAESTRPLLMKFSRDVKGRKTNSARAAGSWVCPFLTDSTLRMVTTATPETCKHASSLKAQHCPLLVRTRSRFYWDSLWQDTHKTTFAGSDRTTFGKDSEHFPPQTFPTNYHEKSGILGRDMVEGNWSLGFELDDL